jgi:hypothetical protein
MIDYMTDVEQIGCLLNMQWVTADLPKGDDHFLLGDGPVVINGGVDGDQICCLSVAVSPTRLLILHQRVEEFDNEFVRVLAVGYSIQVAQQTSKHLISSREIVDSQFIKYSRVVNEMLSTGGLQADST